MALYVVDIDGSHLLRLAGSEEFPARIESPPALVPELVPEGLSEFYERLQQTLPGCAAEPLWLRGRVTGLLLCFGTPLSSLADVAKQGAAAALELADDYTDFIELRHKPTTPAAEIQQNLFPPRIARIAGAQLRGRFCPAMRSAGAGLTSSRIATGHGWRSLTLRGTARRRPASEPRRWGPCAPPVVPAGNSNTLSRSWTTPSGV